MTSMIKPSPDLRRMADYIAIHAFDPVLYDDRVEFDIWVKTPNGAMYQERQVVRCWSETARALGY